MEYIVCCVLFLSALLVVGDGAMVARSPSSHAHQKRDTFSLTDPVASSGDQRLLVLAVEYPSQKGQYPGAQWKSNFFDVWNKFYQAQSYNALQYQIDVVTVDSKGQPVINDPTSTSYIPLPQEISTYANKQYGWGFSTQWNLHNIVRDAGTYLDSKNFDWNPYTHNGNISNVVVMSAGTDYRYAESIVPDAASKYLLSTSYSGSHYTAKNKAILNSYTFCSEHTQDVGSTPLVMAHIGQCAHEFGHALGIPDLYDISGQTSGVGYFDLLGYGVYAAGNQDGSTPVGYGAFPKTQLGWTKPTIIREEKQVDLAASSLASGNFLKIYSNSTNIYYLVENRQAIDTWDKNFVQEFGTGILIWRVNQTAVEQYTVANHINTYELAKSGITNCPPTPSVVLQEADGRQDMSTKGFALNFGSSADVWQLGDQFNGPNGVSIAIVGLKNSVYTIHVSYTGPITIPDNLKGTGCSLYVSLFMLALALLFCLV